MVKKSNAKNFKILLPVILAVVAIVLISFGFISAKSKTSSQSKVQIVAAENFWGSLVSQIGGKDVNVLSIISDPNADPHEYESNTVDAKAIATANYVIENGAGYDSWADKLLSASPSSSRQVLNVANLVGVKDGGNPHLWYNPTFVNQTIAQMEQTLVKLDPSDKNYFENNYQNLKTSLDSYQNRISEIKQQFANTKVAATEDIFVYLAQAAGLNLISPSAFIQAVAEGNDPPTDSVADFQNQLESGQVKVLVYNEQTVTPITESMKNIAANQGIPVVGITETIQPPDTSFQLWMNSELINLENALNAQALGQ